MPVLLHLTRTIWVILLRSLVEPFLECCQLLGSQFVRIAIRPTKRALSTALIAVRIIQQAGKRPFLFIVIPASNGVVSDLG